ncbi:MAG: hypothetical protein VB081_13050 [Christensenella sp.]|uniref:hypothetical protein n=1 Tax=Christensenella sp. TaxID=1935934 RepID=UPI002B1F7862|nr:hypothetical protein [Christensenella sp.]MEA5004406.1 hypothetical protein [Christensenella sp.]
MVQFSLFGLADAKRLTGEYMPVRNDAQGDVAGRIDMHPIHWVWDEPLRRYTEMSFEPISYRD